MEIMIYWDLPSLDLNVSIGLPRSRLYYFPLPPLQLIPMTFWRNFQLRWHDLSAMATILIFSLIVLMTSKRLDCISWDFSLRFEPEFCVNPTPTGRLDCISFPNYQRRLSFLSYFLRRLWFDWFKYPTAPTAILYRTVYLAFTDSNTLIVATGNSLG